MSTVKTPFFIRMAEPADIKECRELDLEAWGEEAAATEEMLASRIATYPYGNFVAARRRDGKIVGSAWAVSLSAEKSIRTWDDTTGGGCYRDVCDPYGEVIFGVNAAARREYAGQRLAQALIVRIIEVGWAFGKRFAQLGARMPYFHEWQDVFEPEDYVRTYVADDGRTFYADPETGIIHGGPPVEELRSRRGRQDPRKWKGTTRPYGQTLRPLDHELAYFMEITAFDQSCKLFRLLPGYFPDPPSCDYGVLIGWENPDHPDSDK